MKVPQQSHRPWPCPTEPWAVAMHWHDLLFMHWPVPTSMLRPLVPTGGAHGTSPLEIDEFDGTAWVGVIPFWMSGIRAHWTPPLPGVSRFPELNVRTYVISDGKPGVYFFSLDAGNAIAVATARMTFHLPYMRATMRVSDEPDGWTRYLCERRHSGGGEARFAARYRPTGESALAERGTLAHWLVERYCLYVVDPKKRTQRGEIHHEPWPLSQGECECEINTMAQAAGITLPDTEPVLHFGKRMDVVAWLAHPVVRAGAPVA